MVITTLMKIRNGKGKELSDYFYKYRVIYPPGRYNTNQDT